jgi:PhzF family phenazine biosynthesis protein
VATLHVLKVFIGEGGRGGNLLGVFLDGQQVPEEARQRVTADLGFSETVFLQDRQRGELRIFTPSMEIPFAGHPLVGTSWLLAQQGGMSPQILRTPAGEIPVRMEDELTFVRGRAEWAPPFEQIELGSPMRWTPWRARQRDMTSRGYGPGRTKKVDACASGCSRRRQA